MFRHYATKAELFRASQLQPFIDLVTTFRESLEAQTDELWDEERLMRTVVEIVYDSFRSHRNGVLVLSRQAGAWDESRQTHADTICPYCGVGCTLTVHEQAGEIVRVTSPLDHSVTQGNLCIKGRFGWQFVQIK